MTATATDRHDAQRIRDHRVNHGRAAHLRARHVPCGWIVVSPGECQKLLDGLVSVAIRRQAAAHLRPGRAGRPSETTDV
jgi:hypothetical protein